MKSFFASRFGIILAAAGLAISSSGITALTATAATSLESSSDSQATQTTLEPTSNIKPTYQLADNDDDDRGEDVSVESLPNAIAKSVLEDVAQRSGMQMSALQIVKVARQTWADGCLGLGDGVCTQALVPGWQVIVAGEEKLWAYRTNEMGTLVKFDETLSQTLTSRVAAEVTRRREVTTRTSQTTQTVPGASGSQSRSSGVVAGSSSSESMEVVGTTQINGGVSTQRQATATRSLAQVSFSDIPQGHWARDFIAELARMEIIDGFPDGQFRPNEPVTRAQFAAMIRKAFKKGKIRNAISFRDVSTSYWAYSPIQECYEMGFLNAASGNLFRPTSSLTRLDIVAALTRGLNYSFTGSTEEMLRFYSDAVSIPADLRSVVAAATQRGIMVNYPNAKSLSLNTVATRAEVAAFIYQSLVSTGEVTAISSPYIVGGELGTMEFNQTGGSVDVNRTEVETRTETETETEVTGGSDRNKPRRNCNQGIGNGAEGCDPGNSRPHGGSNDEGGRTPGNRR